MSEIQEYRLSRLLDGELSSEEVEALSATLSSEEREDLEEFRLIAELLREEHEAACAAADFSHFYEKLQGRLPEQPDPLPKISEPPKPRVWQRAWRGWRFSLALASAATVMVVLATVMIQRIWPPEPEEKLLGGEIIVESVHNEGDQIILISMPTEDDGATVIWMLEDEEEGAIPEGEDPI